MTRSMRVMAIGVAVAMGAIVGVGCSPQSCAITPPVIEAPGSCTLPAESRATVYVRWCNCGASVTCDVTFEGDSFFLEPRVTSCDAECPGSPQSCDIDSTVPCFVDTPPLGEINSYGVQIADGTTGNRESRFNIVASASSTCGP